MRAIADRQLKAHRGLFDVDRLMGFGVVCDDSSISSAKNSRGFGWFLDRGRQLHRLFGVNFGDTDDPIMWIVIDPSLRILACGRASETEAVFRVLRALPKPDLHAGVALTAPVLIVPRVFEADLCRRLIDCYHAIGGEPTGVMKEINGKTVRVLDDFKRRRDVEIADESIQMELRSRIERRLVPEIFKCFQFRPTRMERYLIACYDAEKGGWFEAHRDDTTPGTAHRKFACSINLNAGDYDGGDLRFAEFGSQTYRPPTGGALIFSCSLLHQATPVTRGRRYAFLPFFYDEDGQRIRETNLGSFEGVRQETMWRRAINLRPLRRARVLTGPLGMFGSRNKRDMRFERAQGVPDRSCSGRSLVGNSYRGYLALFAAALRKPLYLKLLVSGPTFAFATEPGGVGPTCLRRSCQSAGERPRSSSKRPSLTTSIVTINSLPNSCRWCRAPAIVQGSSPVANAASRRYCRSSC